MELLGNLPHLVVAFDRELRGCQSFLAWEQYRALTEREDVEM
jgi:hypothetical protein